MRMKGFGWANIVLVIGTLSLVAFGAGPTPPAPTPGQPTPAKPKPPPQVTVIKADGKALAGLLVDADHDGLTLKYGPKADDHHFKWDEIKSVSNGLTRASAIQHWKEAHADKLCGKCHGDRVLKCPDCDGSGIDAKQHKECATCKGTGSAGPCPTKGCVDGKIECPAPCLKLSKGQWKLHPDDGLRWLELKGRRGSAGFISERHVGELIVIENDRPVFKGACPTCKGKGKVDDPVCKGKGHKSCPDCHGLGFTGPACPTCDHGQVQCDECKGTGLRGD
jgi:hypothetical protein